MKLSEYSILERMGSSHEHLQLLQKEAEEDFREPKRSHHIQPHDMSIPPHFLEDERVHRLNIGLSVQPSWDQPQPYHLL